MVPTVTAFLQKWKGSAGNERANKDAFLLDLCAALEIQTPGPKDQTPHYCFEKDLKITHLDGSTSTGSIDLYKEGCLVLEAKQGSTKGRGGVKEGSAPVRGTRAYDQYMEKAFGQAVNYAIRLPQRAPFLLTCDIGHAFHVWEGFSGSYGGYGARRTVPLEDLAKPEVQEWFKAIWENPSSLDPGKRRALVTRQVAIELGHLAVRLEGRFPPQAVANFLMRCVFTFFAEDVGLLPTKLFERSLERWRKEPERFAHGLARLWQAMNTGDEWGEYRLARFNGGLFADSLALDLAKDEIELLHQAARFDWGEVDPSIFGTLLESALSPDERHKLGAHYTPRAFIERLIRPTLEAPLRADWELVQAEALSILGPEPTDPSRAKARDVLHAFHRKLATTRVLDPACGSGNFLYVAYDTLKKLEQEVLSRLEDFGETQRALALDEVMVTPAQFLGLEVKPWAAAIAELVLWIGHLQWWIRQHPGYTPPEPILQHYENVQNRDAVLTWSGTRATGESRWDGRTFKTHPVTRKQVPDEKAQVAILECLDAMSASWPAADFIVGNPPFLGNARMREALGDGYTEALRAAYPEVPDTVDFVLYWWHKAAEAVRGGQVRRFGFITTNSLRQVRQRGVIAHHCSAKNNPLKVLWAVPDHPWTEDGASVRIAMTVGGMEGVPWLGRVVAEPTAATPEAEAEGVRVEGREVDVIHDDLSAGANLSAAVALKANENLASPGMKLHGAGFIISPEQFKAWGRPPVVHPYRNGRDLTDRPREAMVIDLYGMTVQEVQARYPAVYQHVLEHVKPERDQNNRAAYKDNWWIYGEARSSFRPALRGLPRYIATVETAKHRVFQFLDGATVPDNKLIIIASADAYHLGILSSQAHEMWSLASGALLEDRPVYVKSRCFEPFPFPGASEAQKRGIREIAERLDRHRKVSQARGVTLTQMYNLLSKLRVGDVFSDKDLVQHEAAQTEILHRLHEDLDSAVMAAYGLPAGLGAPEILEHLAELNQTRAREETQGLIRWLRPEYQAPAAGQPIPVPILFVPEETRKPTVATRKVSALAWPKDLKDQLAELRALLLASDRLWGLEEVAGAFKSRGRYRESIHAHLDLLTDLRVLAKLETDEGVWYHRPQAIGA